MFTNAQMLKIILEGKNLNIHKLYEKMGCNRNVYTSFEENRFTEKFIRQIEEIVGEDLSTFINCK